MRIILIALLSFTTLMSYADNSFVDKSLLCSTKDFPVKGGFKFISDKTLIKYNILWDHTKKIEFIHKTSHCYLIANNEIAVSTKDEVHKCGLYNSFLNIQSLIYSIPQADKILTANCIYYDKDLEKKLSQSINTTIN